MPTQLMVQPSAFVEAGVQMQMVRGLPLFKFSEALQDRLEVLNEWRRERELQSEEQVELAGILELDRIFTLLNAKVIAESQG